MEKSIVFISHIVPEKEIAIAFKELIEKSFLGLIDVFVSSDEHSISLGQKWLDNITNSLKQCVVEIVLCSPKSVLRPWINFEAGAGWIRDIPVIPLCHSGMIPSKLPTPLNLLQAATANEVSSLKLIFPVLSQALGSQTPNIDFSNFVDTVKSFELKYTFWDSCNEAFEKINKFNAQIIPSLRKGQKIKIDLTESDINYFSSFMPYLEKENILSFSRIGNTRITNTGVFYDCNLNPMSKLQ